MRIAVCISGFARPSNSRLDTFKKHFMDVNKDSEIDIYSCVWDIEGNNLPWHGIEDLRTDTMCIYTGKFWRLNETKLDYSRYVRELESLGANTVTHKVYNYEEYSKKWMSSIPPFQPNFYLSKTPIRIIGILSQMFGVREAFDMIKNPDTYDYIIRTRTDNLFAEDIVIGPVVHVGPQRIKFQNSTPLENPHIQEVLHLFNLKPPTSEMSVMIPWRPHDDNKYMDDMFIIGSPDVMKIITRMYDNSEHIINIIFPYSHPGISGEIVLVSHILSNNIHINIFEKLPALSKG